MGTCYSCNAPNASDNENELAENKEELESIVDDDANKNSSPYQNAINILTSWWQENITILSDDKYLALALEFYNTVIEQIPLAKNMFGSRKIDINLQSLKMLGMFRWIIITLNKSKSLSSSELISGLQQLGKLHDTLGVILEHYLAAGDVFHKTMTKNFVYTYDLRVKWCFNMLYEIVVGVMMQNDFNKICIQQKNQLILIWEEIDAANADQTVSVTECFKNKEIFKYLELYMKESFNLELLLFIMDYNKYKLLTNEIKRNKFGEYLNQLYIKSHSKQQINISGECRNIFYKELKTNNNVYNQNIYDRCYDEVVSLIEISVYPNFKQAIRECIDSIKNKPTTAQITTLKIDIPYYTNRIFTT